MATAHATHDDRRDNHRFDYSVAVRARWGGEDVDASSQDVSAGGMKLRLGGAPPKVGERLQLEFSLPLLGEPVKVEAEVRWIDRASGELFGVQFMTGLRAKEVWAINRLSVR